MVWRLWREKQISSSLGKTERAHGEGVSGWRKQGAEIQSGTVSATLLELEDFKEGSGRSREQSYYKSGRDYEKLCSWLNPEKD